MSAKRHSEAVLVYGGIRASFYGQKFSWDPTRPTVDSSGVEDRSTYTLKGPMSAKIGWEGATADDYERQIFALIVADSNPKPYSLLWGTKPVAGDPANFAVGKVYSGNRTMDRGKLATLKADLVADTEIYSGVVMYNSLFSGGIAAAGTVTSTPQQLGAVPAGSQLVSNFHVPDPPGVSGTTVVITATLQSAVTLGFTSPTDRMVINFTVGGTTVPDGKTVTIDGDATPVTDTYWAWKMVVTGAIVGGLPFFYPVAVGGVQPKNIS